MSGPMKLSSDQLRKIAAALDAMADVTKTHGVMLGGYSGQEIGVDDVVLRVSWDGESYYIDDRNGD